MTKLNRKKSTARKLRLPHKIARSKLWARPLAPPPHAPERSKMGTTSDLENTGKLSSFKAKHSTEDAKIEFLQVLPGPAWLPQKFRENWLQIALIRRSSPRHLVSVVAILSCLVIAMILSGIWFALTGKRDLPIDTHPDTAKTDTAEADPKTLATSKRTEALRVVSSFLSAETIEEKLLFVRHPDVVGPEIRRLFQDSSEWAKIIPSQIGNNYNYRNHSNLVVETTVLQTEQPLPGNPFGIFILTTTPEGSQLIDWEASHHKNKSAFTEFREKRSVKSERFRISIKPYDYYNHGFSEEKYQCLRVTCLAEPNTTMYAYIEKNSSTEEAILKIYPPIGKFFGVISVTANLRYLPNSSSPDHVEFVELVYPGWILPDSFYEK